MSESAIWSIGSADGRSADLYDNYKTPNALGNVVWRAGAADGAKQQWPLFHPSEADPDAGYRLHPYTIHFDLDEEPQHSYLLHIQYLVIAPRLSFLEIDVNGFAGRAYFRPVPSQSGEIRLHAGLHTTIYSEGTVEMIIPGALLNQGANQLTLTSRDDAETLIVDRIEAIKRLDRMANGAGFIYQHIRFSGMVEPVQSVIRRINIVPSVVYLRNERDELVERCHLDVELNGRIDPSAMTISLMEDGRPIGAWNLELPQADFGHLRLMIDVPDGEGAVDYHLQGSINGISMFFEGSFNRRRKWHVYISSHSHTDIGYTHRQWEVAERLCRNIDKALDLLEAEEHEDGDERTESPSFAYHMDASWALETYLATRGERRKGQLLKYIRSGRINLASNYMDLLTQYAALEDLIRNGEFTESFMRPEGMRADLAAVVDVASMSSSMPAVLEGSGVKYLIHANNQDRGPFRLNGGLHRISPFYWEGHQGGKVLCWLAKMYCELRKVCGSPPVLDSAERGLDMWLQEYETDRYAPDAVLLYGQEADNTDIDPQPNDFVKRWNERYAYPRLIATDISDFFRYVEERFGDTLQTVKGDGGAYWEDGALSSIAPTIKVRETQAMLPAAERLESLAVIHNGDWEYPTEHFDDAWRELLSYVEHTWGAFLSCTEPEARLAKDQWAIKEHMANSAEQWGKRLLHSAATRHSLSWNNQGREVVVYNPHSWPVNHAIQVEIGCNEMVIDPATGNEVPIRTLEKGPAQAVVELWVDNIPGFSYRRLVLKERNPRGGISEDLRQQMKNLTEQNTIILENDHYKLTINTVKGGITGWFDKELQKEWVDRNDPWTFGQLIYAKGGEGTRLVSNQADLPEKDPELIGSFRLDHAEIHRYVHGSSVKFAGSVHCGELEVEWTLPNADKRVDVRYKLRKEAVLDKEAVYIAFPLDQPGGGVLSDSQLGWVNWHTDQLPGGCKEWLPLQTGVLSRGEQADVFIASPDIPLFCIGDVVQGRWPKHKNLTGGRIFSYILNNYWNTNYKASQGGEISFRYSLTSGKSIQAAAAYRFGWNNRLPLYAVRMSYQDFRDEKRPYTASEGGTLACLSSDEVVVSTIKKAKWAEGFIVRLQEIAGKPQSVRLSFPHQVIRFAWETDLLEQDLRRFVADVQQSVQVDVPAWGMITIRIVLEKETESGR
jgi:alpha-mannosidase